MYKVLFYKTVRDRLDDKRSEINGLTFEQAVSWFHTLVGNHNGAVSIIEY